MLRSRHLANAPKPSQPAKQTEQPSSAYASYNCSCSCSASPDPPKRHRACESVLEEHANDRHPVIIGLGARCEDRGCFVGGLWGVRDCPKGVVSAWEVQGLEWLWLFSLGRDFKLSSSDLSRPSECISEFGITACKISILIRCKSLWVLERSLGAPSTIRLRASPIRLQLQRIPLSAEPPTSPLGLTTQAPCLQPRHIASRPLAISALNLALIFWWRAPLRYSQGSGFLSASA